LWAQALGHAACRASYRVLFIQSDGLLKNLARSRVDNSFDRFIASHEAMAVGSRLDLHFLLPEGEIRVQAIFRNVRESRGMSVEFVSMGGREFDLIPKAIQRLLG